MYPSYNDTMKELSDEIYVESMNEILESHETLDERLASINDAINKAYDNVLDELRYHLEYRRKDIIRSIKWRLASIHNDHRLIDDLIEDDIAEDERRADEYIRQLEEGD